MKRPLYVLVDTNVAILQAYFFRKQGGMELIAALKAIGGRLVVPDVLQREYIKHFGELASTTQGSALKELDKLETLSGHSLIWLLPKEDLWQLQAQTVLEQIKEIILPVPETDSLLLAASRRSMNDRAPCSKTDHGYKDCLIWESLLSVAQGADVRLITKDKAFYEDEKCNQPARNLVAEAAARDFTLKAYSGKDSEGKDTKKSPLIAFIEDILSENKELKIPKVRFQPSDHPLNKASIAALPPTAVTHAAPPAAAPAEFEEKRAELFALFSSTNDKFRDLETKVLGFIAFLDGMPKEALLNVLEDAGIERRIAGHVCDRLALAGLVEDTGNYYLPSKGRLSELAAALVQSEVIKLMGKRGP